MTSVRYLLSCLAAGAAALAISSCAVGGGLSGSSTCKDFMNADEQTRQKVINDLYTAAHDPAARSAMGEVNILVNSEYICGGNPDRKLNELPM